MFHLMRAEWLKLTKRPLTWVLLAVFLALLLLQMLTQFVLLSLAGGLGLAGEQGALTEQFAEWQRRMLFPGVFGAAFSHINGLGGIFAVIFMAGAMGSEYSWGTLRPQLARFPVRVRYLFAKVVVVLGLLLVAMVVTLLVAALVSVGLGVVGGSMGSIGLHDVVMLPLAMVRALYVLLPYVLLTLCVTIVGRSLLVGVAGGLVYLVFEAGFGALSALAMLGGVWRVVYNLTIQQNINTLVWLNDQAFGLHPEVLTPSIDVAQQPSPLQACLMIALYSAGFLATAVYTFQRRDITGAV